MKKWLFIIDLQRQFKDKKTHEIYYQRCLNFVKDNACNYDGILGTLFVQSRDENNFKEHLNWNDCSYVRYEDLEYLNHIENIEAQKQICSIGIEKINSYGISPNSIANMIEENVISKEDQIDIIGCDGDACVMAVCFQLWDEGFKNLRILEDYIYSSGDLTKFDRINWLHILRRNFGDCVIQGDECEFDFRELYDLYMYREISRKQFANALNISIEELSKKLMEFTSKKGD